MVAFFMTSEYDWRYVLKPKDNIAGNVQERKMMYPRGYTLGGSRFAGSLKYFLFCSSPIDFRLDTLKLQHAELDVVLSRE